ncbi:hypothetical protein [Flavobacterium sp.]|uniref:hypothetical protein n=1 Tax=Flavobacterium sp. TaxID=239 RepID=UPI0031DCE23B
MNIFENQKIIKGIQRRGQKDIWLDNSREFLEVHHITHLPAAKYLMQSEQIIPQLIQDKSRLNGELIKVVWLSPNEWHDGSIYGNIRFSYRLSDLVRNKKFYTVEVMSEYTPQACRILISDKDYVDHEIIKPYDPGAEYSGPLHIDSTGRNFYNKAVNIEFMFEGELNIEDALKIDFVTHHKELCNINPNNSCPDSEMTGQSAKLFFICHLLANGIKMGNLAICKENKDILIREITKILEMIYKILDQDIQYAERSQYSEDSKMQLVRAILGRISEKDNEAAIVLSKIFDSRKELYTTLKKIFAEYFAVKEEN